MKFMSSAKRKVASICIAVVLACSFVLAPVSQTLKFMTAEATPTEESGPALGYHLLTSLKTAAIYIKEAASAGFNFITSGATLSLAGKEFTLDGIAWYLVNLALSEMIQSTTRWVNSGFQGSPAFVTDLNGYLLDLGDRAAGDFIWGSDLGFLCSPFRLNIQLALEIQYNASQRFETQCRLSQVVDNMDAFFGGDFLAGGWDGWYQVATVPQNNPYGAMLDAQAGLSASIQNTRGQAITMAGWGDGFLSRQKCDDPVMGPRTCKTITPGSVIQEQLNGVLKIPAGRLTVADEINELFGALLGQLVSNALSGAGGLLGLTDSNYGSGDYFERVDAENLRAGQAAGVSSAESFTKVIDDESDYLAQRRSLLALLNNARLYKNTTYGTSTRCASGALPVALANEREISIEIIASTTEVINDLKELEKDLKALQNQNTPDATIKTLLTKYQATKESQAQTNLLNKYIAIRQGGILHSPASTNEIKLGIIPDTKDKINDFKDEIDLACKAGRVVVPPVLTVPTTTATST
jgi:hypothetical protein